MSDVSVPDTASAGPVDALQRKDNWWGGTLWFFCAFSLFGVWTTFRAFQNNFYATGTQPSDGQMQVASYSLRHVFAGFSHYLSPFYSPTIHLPWHLAGFGISPALLILIFPLSFRLSCYYYRRSIYRAYLLDPAGCAISEPEPLRKRRFKRYTGERFFPLIAQNFHRFAFYAAVVFIVILWKDALDGFIFAGPNGGLHFGVGVGSLVLLANIVLLSGYTFGCHSWRHLIGGNINCFSCQLTNHTRHGLWKKVTFLNERHGRFAMWSLVSVGVADLYIWLVCTGHIIDIRFF
ncbi:MAG: succinate dehydrogenase [Armatimonadetes bacterium]|nr:succinate dehydrogenase [Armatimonadota bacterium]MDE2205147.1 succinate dehydrogenase [Armatimonadota bacterium]